MSHSLSWVVCTCTCMHMGGCFCCYSTGARRRVLDSLAAVPGTLIMYAPPHGLAAVLADCVAVLGPSRRCCVAREISKLHEEYFR